MSNIVTDVKDSVVALFNGKIHTSFKAIPGLSQAKIVAKTAMVGLGVLLVGSVMGPIGLLAAAVVTATAFCYFTHKAAPAFDSANWSSAASFITKTPGLAKDLAKQVAVRALLNKGFQDQAMAILFNAADVEAYWKKGEYLNAIQALMP